MNLKITLKSRLLLAALAFGLSASARAGEGPTAATTTAEGPMAPALSLGLLGQTYAGLTYSHINLDGAPVNADSYGLEYNWALNPGFDAVFNYDWAQSGLVAGERAREQTLTAALREFITTQRWGKPYVEAGIGYDWAKKFAGVKDRSFVWLVAAGVEFQAAPALTITPFVRYTRTDGYDDEDTVNYGVKANYWVTRQWAVTGGIDRSDDHDMTYKLGLNVSF